MKDQFLLPASVLIAGVLISGAVLWDRSQPPVSGQIAGTGEAPALAADIKSVNLEGAPHIGNADAPVVMAMWGDFQCGYCKKFELETLPQIVEAYVNTGKVKVVMFDFPFLSENSLTAATYNHAVWKLYPARYLSWRKAMFEAQGPGFGDAASIDKLNASIPGLDAAKISADVKANRDAYVARASTEKAEGQKQGINSTPSVVIGSELIVGAFPYPRFEAALDDLLQ